MQWSWHECQCASKLSQWHRKHCESYHITMWYWHNSSTSTEEKYMLLKHHNKLSSSHVFPTTYLGGFPAKLADRIPLDGVLCTFRWHLLYCLCPLLYKPHQQGTICEQPILHMAQEVWKVQGPWACSISPRSLALSRCLCSKSGEPVPKIGGYHCPFVHW